MLSRRLAVFIGEASAASQACLPHSCSKVRIAFRVADDRFDCIGHDAFALTLDRHADRGGGVRIERSERYELKKALGVGFGPAYLTQEPRQAGT